MFNDTINLIKILFKELYKLFESLFERFKDFFINFIDTVFNGKNYRYYISFILILIGLLIYLFLNNNPFFSLNRDDEIKEIEKQMQYQKHKDKYKYEEEIKKIYENVSKNIKFTELTLLVFGGILLSFFYFFVYRKDSALDDRYISLDDRNISKSELKKNFSTVSNPTSNSSYKRKYEFARENFKESIKLPIINLLTSTFYIIAAIFIPILIISAIFYSFKQNSAHYNIFKSFLYILILITCLSLIAYGLKLHTKDNEVCIENSDDMFSITLIICIIRNIIFFIPCLLTVFIEKLNNDIKLTPSPVYILFFILIILITLTFLLPLAYKYIINSNKHRLLETIEPVYLNKKQTIGKYQHFKNEKNKLSTPGTTFSIFDNNEDQDFNLEISLNGKPKLFPYNYSYSISFYLYLNPQEKNTSYAYNKEEGAELFNYGCKPKILYNGKKQQIIIKSKTKDNNCSQSDTIFKSKDDSYGNIDIKFQKWLYFVINYENNIIDVFIDGKLVASKPNVPDFTDNDKITIGEDNGIHGSIKDIFYYDIPQPQNQIEFLHDIINR
tara:strand:- start:469 stop:2133 length:1665 start_codon:yes stop_codon:yes gene_type:complete